MSASLKQSFIYNDATAGKAYMPVTLDGTTENQIVLAAATTDFPLGVIAEDTKEQGQTIGVLMERVMKGVSAGAIAVGDNIGVEAEGKFSPLTNPAAFVAGAPKWCWGKALTATTGADQLVTFAFTPSIIHTAD